MIEIKKINWKAIILGGIISTILSDVLHTDIIPPLSIVISTFIGGLIAAKISADDGWKHGMGVGAFHILVHIPSNLIFTRALQTTEPMQIPLFIVGYMFAVILITIPSGIIGGRVGSEL